MDKRVVHAKQGHFLPARCGDRMEAYIHSQASNGGFTVTQ